MLKRSTSTKHGVQVDAVHFGKWMDALYSGTYRQAKEALFDAATSGYCCLGVGCLLVPYLHQRYDAGNGTKYFGEEEVSSKAPREFIEWLGLTMPSFGDSGDYWSEADIAPDFGPLLTQGEEDAEGGTYSPPLTETATGAGMNDSGFTFSQIADTFTYFGIGGVVE